MEVNTFKERLVKEDYKHALLILLEKQGTEILIDKAELKTLIHEDPLFFLDLIRVYCFKSAQVGVDYTPEFLLNAVGVEINKGSDDYLYLTVEGLEPTGTKEDDYSGPSFEEKLESTLMTVYEKTFKKKDIKAKTEEVVVGKNMSAVYKVYSRYKDDTKAIEALYYLGAYTQDKLLKELPNYFPAGALDFSSLLRENQLSKQNSLLRSNDDRAIVAYFKLVGDTDANSKFREQMQKDVIGLRDKRYAQMLADIDEDVVEHWDHYSHHGGLTYEEQRQDNLSAYTIMLNNVSSPSEKSLVEAMVKHMDILYKANHDKFKKKP